MLAIETADKGEVWWSVLGGGKPCARLVMRPPACPQTHPCTRPARPPITHPPAPGAGDKATPELKRAQRMVQRGERHRLNLAMRMNVNLNLPHNDPSGR